MSPLIPLQPLIALCACLLVDAGRVEPRPVVARTPTLASEIATKLADELEHSYVLEDKAHAMAAALRAHADSDDWKRLEGDALAEALTRTCREIANDLHFKVRFDREGAPKPTNAFFLDPEAARREWTQRNYGFERAERMQGNVGYLDVREFVPTDLSRATATAAMAFLQDTDALVIDLRRNGGGDPESVRFLCSYFFSAEPVHLNTLVNREMGSAEEFWTLADLPGQRYLDKPVFVLTSPKTFSAAEEFAYDLQSLGRARVVGATTGGGAHPVDRRSLGKGFSATIPVARAENPVTKTNWESVGVKPDVAVPEDEALDRAWSLALEHLAEREKDPERHAELLRLAVEKRGEKTAR